MAVLDGSYFCLCLASETPRLTSGLEWTRDGRSCLHFHTLGPAPLRPSVSSVFDEALHPHEDLALAVIGSLPLNRFAHRPLHVASHQDYGAIDCSRHPRGKE